MRTQERFRGVVTRLLALSLLAAVPGSASTQPIPLEIDVGTLYEGALSGSIVHTARVSRPGAFALFIFGGREPIAFSATLPDGSAIDHQFSDTTGNFLFLDVDRAGSIDLEFDVDLDPRSDSLFYAFVLAPVVDLAIDEWGLFDLQRAPIAGDANEALGLGVFRVRPPEDVLLTLEIERERYNLDIRGGGPDASSSVYDKYAGDPSEESAVLRQAVRAGTEFGFIVLREPIDGVIEAPIELSISTEALVPTEPRELSFNEFVPGRLDTFSPLESGRKAAPYYYEGTAGEQIAIVLESVDFDTLILVRTPAGDLVEDDDGAWQTNSILELTLPESGRYDIFATSFAGSETGEFAIQVLSPQDARDYVAGMDPWGYEESEEFASEEIEEVFLEDTITGVTGLVVGAASEGSISETSSVYRGSYVEVFEVTLASSIDLEISLTSDSFDTLLIVTEPAGSELDDDDGGSGTNSRLRIPAAAPGTYRIYARAW
ncbi:MAG TPA: PPC domain-containing protein, partial [Spirochaetia bacterium]|nr:PPC domain-containing protein [Spirochaetia bacterium]